MINKSYSSSQDVNNYSLFGMRVLLLVALQADVQQVGANFTDGIAFNYEVFCKIRFVEMVN